MAWSNAQSKEAWVFEEKVMKQYDQIMDLATQTTEGNNREKLAKIKALSKSIRVFETSLNYFQDKNQYDEMVRKAKKKIKEHNYVLADELDEEAFNDFFEQLMVIVDSIVFQFKYLGIRKPVQRSAVQKLNKEVTETDRIEIEENNEEQPKAEIVDEEEQDNDIEALVD